MASVIFTGTDQSPLSSPWVSDAVFGGMSRLSNAAQSAPLGDHSSRYSGATSNRSQVTIAAVGDGNGGPAIHCDGAGGCYFLTNYSGISIQIYRVVAGDGWTGLDAYFGVYEAGDEVTLYRESGSGDLVAELNGTEIMRVAGETTLTGGNDGMFAYGGGIRFSEWTNAGSGGGGGGPSITSVNTTNVVASDATGMDIAGTGFSSATVEMRQGAVAVSQTVNSQSGTAIDFDVEFDTPSSGDLKYGEATLSVLNGDDSEDTIPVDIEPPDGEFYVDVDTPDSESAYRIETDGDGLESGDQIHVRGDGGGPAPVGLHIEADGTFWFDEGELPTAFDARVWDHNDATWGAWETQSIVNIGISEEADTSLALAHRKVRATGTSTQTNSAQGLSRKKAKAVGVSISASTSLALGAVKSRSTGLASSSNQSQALTGTKLRATGVVATTNSALSLGKVKTKSLSLSSGTSTALTLAAVKASATGLSTSSNSALALSKLKTKSAGLATESDASLSLSTGFAIQVGISAETDEIPALSRKKTKSASVSAETATAFGLGRIKSKATGLLSDVGTSLTLVRVKARATGLSASSGACLALSGFKRIAVGRSTETSTTFALIGSGGSSGETNPTLDATLPVQEALFEKLSASSPLAIACAGTPKVFDTVPKGEATPFITIGDLSSADDSCKGEPGQDFDLTIHVWDEGPSSVRLKQMMAAIILELHDNGLDVDDDYVDVWLVRYLTSGVIKDADGVTLHGVIRFRLATTSAIA